MYAGIDSKSRKWDTFKDYAHLKLMLSRDGQKELIKDYGTHRGVDVDLGKIYKKGLYEITVNSDQLKKAWTRTQIISGKLNSEQQREDIRGKAQAFANRTAKVTGIDKRSMSIKVEAINDDRFIALNKRWKREDQDKQDEITKNPFRSRVDMARLKWPPFTEEEKQRLFGKYNQRYFQMVRFADKREQVQGEYSGDFIHQGVRVGIIDTENERKTKFTLVPFAEELDSFKGKDVRYNLASREVSDKLHKQMRMTISDTVKNRSHTKTVTIEMGNAEDEVTQKKALARAGRRGFGPNSGELKVSFKELTREQKQQRHEQELSRNKGLSL